MLLQAGNRIAAPKQQRAPQVPCRATSSSCCARAQRSFAPVSLAQPILGASPFLAGVLGQQANSRGLSLVPRAAAPAEAEVDERLPVTVRLRSMCVTTTA